MPLMQCSEKGQKGWKYGESGKCYVGPSGKKLAVKQGLAEHHGKWVDASTTELTKGELEECIKEFEDEKLQEQIVAYVSQKERDSMPSEDFGDPANKKFPVKDQKHMDAAVKLLGRESPAKQKEIKARLKKIAKRKGLKMPKTWENE